MAQNILLYRTGSKKYEKPTRIPLNCLSFNREVECKDECGVITPKEVGPKTAHVITIPLKQYVLDCADCKPACAGVAEHGTLKLESDNNCKCN